MDGILTSSKSHCHSDESDSDIFLSLSRMIPIVFALVPTIVGAAMLIGLNDSGNKGALLFGELNALLLEDFADETLSDVPHWNVR